MLVREVTRRWLWAGGAFQESDKERDDATITAIAKCEGVFTDVVISLPRLVKFKDRILRQHTVAHDAGMASLHGRRLWYRPDSGNEGLNAKYNRYPFFEQIVAEIQAEAKMIQDLIGVDVVGTMIDLEGYTTDDPAFKPGDRDTVVEWSRWKKYWTNRRCGKAVIFLGQLALAYPNRGTKDYGKTFSRLSKKQWGDPTTYRLKGVQWIHPDGYSETFWTTWGRPVGYVNPNYDADDQPLLPQEILDMTVPDNTTDWGLYCPADTRSQSLLDLVAIW